MSGSLEVKVRAIVDASPNGCTAHGPSSFSLCPHCTLEALVELGNASHVPTLAVNARRTFGGLHALIHADEALPRFGETSKLGDVVRVPRGQHTIAAYGLADALARLVDGPDIDGSRQVAIEALVTTCDALGLDATHLVDVGRKRRDALLARTSPPPAAPAPPRAAEDPTAGFRLDGDVPPRRRRWGRS